MPRQEGERKKEMFRCALSEMDEWIQQVSGQKTVPNKLLAVEHVKVGQRGTMDIGVHH